VPHVGFRRRSLLFPLLLESYFRPFLLAPFLSHLFPLSSGELGTQGHRSPPGDALVAFRMSTGFAAVYLRVDFFRCSAGGRRRRGFRRPRSFLPF